MHDVTCQLCIRHSDNLSKKWAACMEGSFGVGIPAFAGRTSGESGEMGGGEEGGLREWWGQMLPPCSTDILPLVGRAGEGAHTLGHSGSHHPLPTSPIKGKVSGRWAGQW